MHRFFAPDIATALTLPEEESQHAVRVLRLKEGDLIEVVDGIGTTYACRISMAHPKKCAVEITEKQVENKQWNGNIIVAVAPTKNLDRMEWMAEKMTEMGIDRIIPIECRFSERRVLKTERLHKILVSAMKQSLKATLPQLDEMTPVMDAINMPFEGNKYIAHCEKDMQRRLLAKEVQNGADSFILIGPEGDFSREEINAALKAGFMPVSLGRSRLRTETAALMACATCHVVDGIHTE
ncbi:MAG: 16S rRNA (uracil(1498)-N(3))-methyltransferase [Muribaculaceae bacterium]|jgi:16S rRNA (uracil1498-N3)-methyltransferase|nr:16S rRNA (uracil(1498)-N(3))-methyltransferase [Muribaculaceae bacterium]